MKIDHGDTSEATIDGEYIDQKGIKFAIVHKPATESERNVLWSHDKMWMKTLGVLRYRYRLALLEPLLSRKVTHSLPT